MANLDFTPLFRSTIGFERVPRLLQAAMRVSDSDLAFPPYNIEKVGDDAYRIVIALAGFGRHDLEIVREPNQLIVRGRKVADDNAEYLHRGIAARAFERRFDLADYIEVERAELENGLLTIALKRELPEELKPRRIEIANASDERQKAHEQAHEAAQVKAEPEKQQIAA